MKPAMPLFAKILAWFFLNMILVAAALAIFIFFQSHESLYAIFDQQGTDRLRTAGLLIAHGRKNPRFEMIWQAQKMFSMKIIMVWIKSRNVSSSTWPFSSV